MLNQKLPKPLSLPLIEENILKLPNLKIFSEISFLNAFIFDFLLMNEWFQLFSMAVFYLIIQRIYEINLMNCGNKVGIILKITNFLVGLIIQAALNEISEWNLI